MVRGEATHDACVAGRVGAKVAEVLGIMDMPKVTWMMRPLWMRKRELERVGERDEER